MRLLLPLCLFLLLCLAAPLALAQQGQPATAEEIIARLRSLPPGTQIELVQETATGTGVGVTTTGEKIDSALQTGAPSVSLPPASAQGGGSESHIRVWGSSISPAVIVLALGGLICWGGAVAALLLRWGVPRTPIVLAAAGLGFFAAALFPAATVFLLAGVLVAGGIAYVWSERGGTRAGEALRAVVAGVAAAPAEAAAAVKAEIGKHADEHDKRTIKGIKSRDDLA